MPASIRSWLPPISLDREGEPIYPISHKPVAHPFPDIDKDRSSFKQSSEIAPSVFIQSYEAAFEIFEGNRTTNIIAAEYASQRNGETSPEK